MTFAAFETDPVTGEPIELYRFTLGGNVYLFSSSEDDYPFQSETYRAVPISRTAVALSGEQRQDKLTVEMPADEVFPQLYAQIVPGQRASLTVRRLHRQDTDLEAILRFKGQVQSVNFLQGGNTVQITVMPLSQGMAREIPRYTYQGLCNHFLYDARCKVLQSP